MRVLERFSQRSAIRLFATLRKKNRRNMQLGLEEGKKYREGLQGQSGLPSYVLHLKRFIKVNGYKFLSDHKPE